MSIVVVDPAAPDAGSIGKAADVLRAGHLVAFPTETVYGLGANALDPAAVDRIYAAKGRPSYNPLIVHVSSVARAQDVVALWPDAADRLAQAFWPGPLTLVLPRRAIVAAGVTAGLDTVAVRVPAHPVALALITAADLPVAAPSANRSTEVSPTTAAHVEKSLGDRVDMILDGGPTHVGIESTVLDLSSAHPTLLRPGMISIARLEAIVGPIVQASHTGGEAARPSPGMLEKHYSPRARVVLVDASDVGMRVEQERASSQRVGAMVITADVEPSSTIMRLPAEAEHYASRLYATLHALDDVGSDVIVIERVPNSSEWLGVQDRLRRAAHD